MSISEEGNEAGGPDWADSTEQAVLDAALLRLSDHGHWDQRLVDLAASDIGLTPSAVSLLLPGGPRDLAALLSQRHDNLTLARLSSSDAKSLKIRAKIVLRS